MLFVPSLEKNINRETYILEYLETQEPYFSYVEASLKKNELNKTNYSIYHKVQIRLIRIFINHFF